MREAPGLRREGAAREGRRGEAKALEKFKARPGPTTRRWSSGGKSCAAIAAAREVRGPSAGRRPRKPRRAAREAIEKTEREARERREAIEKVIRDAAEAAERKAERDRRYAARKARQK